MSDPEDRADPVLAEDVSAIADQLEALGADAAAATLYEAASRLEGL